jgi:hypothetical protein
MNVTTHSTSADVWTALAGMFSSHTHAQPVNTHIALATTRKSSSTMAEYYSKMKSFADEMVVAGHRLGDEESIAYVLSGLDEEIHNSLVSSIVTRNKPISPAELYSQMLSYELRLEKQSVGAGFFSSANAATGGRGGPWHGGGGPSRGRGRSRGNDRGFTSGGSRGGFNNTNGYLHPPLACLGLSRVPSVKCA